MKNIKKTLVILLLTCFIFTLFAGMASAHVVVYPRETTQGSYEKFAVRVPSETEGTSTVKVELTIPEGVNISRIEPRVDWEYELSYDDSGKVIRVAWTAVGEGLSITEFTDFNMQGKVGDAAESLVWKAYQTYADDSVVEWIGAAGSDKPASVTVVHERVDAASQEEEAADSQLTLILTIIALVLSVVALIFAIIKRKSA